MTDGIDACYIDNLIINASPEKRQITDNAPVFHFENQAGTPRYFFTPPSSGTSNAAIQANPAPTGINKSARVLEVGFDALNSGLPDKDSLIIQLPSPLRVSEETHYLHFMVHSSVSGLTTVVNNTHVNHNPKTDEWTDLVVDLTSMQGKIIYEIKILPKVSSYLSAILYIDSIRFNSFETPSEFVYLLPETGTYMIFNRKSNHALAATPDNNLIQQTTHISSDWQQWELLKKTDKKYMIRNKENRKVITDVGAYFLSLNDPSELQDGQLFSIVHLEDDFIRITSDKTNKSLDIEGESIASGANVGVWDFGASNNLHRQWRLSKTSENIDTATVSGLNSAFQEENIRIIYGAGGLTLKDIPLQSTVYIHSIAGHLLFHSGIDQKQQFIQLEKGSYVVTVVTQHRKRSYKGIVY